MMPVTMNWPSFFPASCPPAASLPADGEVYRLTEGTRPGPRDFLSHRELFPKRRLPVSECAACGISVYRDRHDITTLVRRIPKMLDRLQSLALGVLRADFGVVVPTPSREEHSHCTWWIPLEAEPWSSFEPVDFPEKEAP